MSALTDLFSAMATKIRSKTGTATTYTPPEMVSDGIDDVYEAGVAAGTPTLTGNATAADVVSGKTFYNTTTTKQTGSFAADTVNNSATATTSQSTKTPDSGKYFANFTINPQQHSDSFTPTADLVGAAGNANDMGAVHNKRYVNTSGMIVPSGNIPLTQNDTGIDVSSYATASVSVSGTSITPSNSSPASMSSGTLYTPSASGYAISSYSSVTPSNSSPATLSSGSIYKMGGAGKAVASVTSVAPSNTSPASLTSGTVYKPSANGVAISSYSSITPSSTSQSVSSGSIYKMGGNGIVLNALPTLSGDAGAGDVLSGKYFYSNSYTKQQGTISSKAAATYNTSSSDQTISSGQYLSGAQTIKAVTTSGISAANIKDGTTIKVGDANSATRIANVTGTFTDASTVSSGQTAAGAAQIKSGYSAWVDGAEVKGSYTEPTLSGDADEGNVLYGKTFYKNSYTKKTGSMTNQGAWTSPTTPGTGNTCNASTTKDITVPAGYHSGSGYVRIASLASQTGVDSGKTAVTAAKMFSGYQGWVNGSKISGTYTEPIIEQIVPSDSQPVGLQVNSTYLAKASGYAIENSPTTLTPNDSDPPTIASGVIYKGGGAGFAVETKPTKTVTTLWTNSSPTSTFGQQDITGLASGISNFDYIRITYRWGKTDSTSQSTTFAVDEIPSSTGRAGFGMRVGTTTRFRPIYKSSNTSIYVYGAYATSSTSASSDYLIPTKIEGIKYNGIS